MSVVVNGSIVDNNVCLWSRTLILENDSGRSAKDELEGKTQREGNDLGALHQVHAMCKVFSPVLMSHTESVLYIG